MQILDKASAIQYQYITEHTCESPVAKETSEHPKNADLSGSLGNETLWVTRQQSSKVLSCKCLAVLEPGSSSHGLL